MFAHLDLHCVAEGLSILVEGLSILVAAKQAVLEFAANLVGLCAQPWENLLSLGNLELHRRSLARLLSPC